MEKFESRKEPEVVEDPRGRGRMLIPTPRLIDSLIRRVPRGRLVSVEQIRERLAKDFDADLTCPMTTGIFIRIVAEAAEERRRAGEREITPYWRVVKRGGRLLEKLPGGAEKQAQLLRNEGHIITRIKGALWIKDYEEKLVSL